MALSTKAKWGGLVVVAVVVVADVVVAVVITVTTIIIKIKRKKNIYNSSFTIICTKLRDDLDFMKWHYQLRLNGEACFVTACLPSFTGVH